MKKILSILLLVLLATLAGCDGGSSSSSATTKDAVNAMYPKAMAAAGAAMSSAMTSAPGAAIARSASTIESGTKYPINSTDVSGYDGTSVSGFITINDDSTFDGTLRITFVEYTSEGVTINGTYNYTFSSSSSSVSGTLTGTLTVLYEGVSYSMTMNLTFNDEVATGTITCDSVIYTI